MRFLLLLLVACSGETAKSTPKIEVASGGPEPRKAYVYAIKPVDRAIRVEYVMDPEREKSDAVKTHLDVAWQCTKTCTYAITGFAFDSPTGPEPSTDEKRIQDQILDQAKKVHGKVTVKSNGWLTIEPSAVKFAPSFPDLLRLVVVPFPDEPLGVGAKWSARDTDLERSYTLVAPDAVDVFFTMKEGKSSLVGRAHLAISLADPVATGTITQETTLELGPDMSPTTMKFAITVK